MRHVGLFMLTGLLFKGWTRRWLKVKQKTWTVEEDRSRQAGGSRGPPPR
jgi:hypothetical protein